MQKRKVYFDMDGVLADFDRAYFYRCGNDRHPHGGVKWDKIEALGDFFLKLEPISYGLSIWEHIPKDQRYILSASPNDKISGADEQKRNWFTLNNVDVYPENIFLVPDKKLKKTFVQTGDILIDDREDNIKDWIDAGGVGMRFGGYWPHVLDILNNLCKLSVIDTYKN